MSSLTRATRPQYRQPRFVLRFVALLFVTAMLLLLNQPVAAGLIPLIAILLIVIAQRDARALRLARQIMSGQAMGKLEVPPGDWGELCRAINGLMQERRIEQRLLAVGPAPLPVPAMQALLNGNFSTIGEHRTVVVLLVSCGGNERFERYDQQDALEAWKSLALVAQDQAYQQSALLQPCGDAMMIVFGAFTEQPTHALLQAAMAVANTLQHNWLNGSPGAHSPLVLSVTSGPALIAMLPGLGCCVIGTPVDQAIQIERQALSAPHNRLLCSESAYYVLRRTHGTGWAPSELRVHSSEHEPQTVYSWSGYVLER